MCTLHSPEPNRCFLYEPASQKWSQTSDGLPETSWLYGWDHHPDWGLVIAGGHDYRDGKTYPNYQK